VQLASSCMDVITTYLYLERDRRWRNIKVEEVNVMKQTLEAIYEKGVFKPLKRPEISEGQQVRLTVETPSEWIPEDMLELAAQVYQGLSDKQIDEIEQIALNRRNFFRKRI